MVLRPTSCKSCGKTLSHLYKVYDKEIKKKGYDPDTEYSKDISNEDVFEKLGVYRYCCRILFFTGSDIINNLFVNN